MDNFLEKYILSWLTQEETENNNRPITSKEIQLVMKKLPKNTTTEPDGFTAEFYQTLSEDLIPIILKVFQKVEEEGILPNSSYEPNIKYQKQAKIPQKKKIKDQYP